MNIDQRLDRLTERHEALTQSVDIIHADIGAISKDIDKLSRIAATTLDSIQRLERIYSRRA